MLPEALGTEIKEALGEYVYALEDPRSGRVFYVGRGIQDRVLHHARDSLDDAVPGAKLDLIRDIRRNGLEPRAWILRRRISRRPGAAEMEALPSTSSLVGTNAS